MIPRRNAEKPPPRVLFSRFSLPKNPFDRLLALCLCALLLTTVLDVIKPRGGEAQTGAEVTVRVEGILPGAARTIAGQGVLFWEDRYPVAPRGAEIGTATVLCTDRRGQMHALPSARRVTLYLTLTVTGRNSPDGFLLEGQRYIAPNMTVRLTADGVDCSGKVMNIAINAPLSSEDYGQVVRK